MSHIKNWQLHQQLFALAIPMILSNITVPLLGLVDTAVMGHLDQSYYLAGSTVGAMVITFVVWLCGFLRMSTTGLTAQAFGKKDSTLNLDILLRGLAVALLLAITLIALQVPYINAGLYLAGGSEQVQFYARQYSEIRIWGLPASLANLVLLGWLLGNQKAKAVMWILIVTNVCNVVLDVVFVLGFEWKVQGVAFATLIAEYLGLTVGLTIVAKTAQGKVAAKQLVQRFKSIFQTDKMSAFFNLNRDILIRTLCLELCFVFITFQGARLGDDIVAANAILMNFLLLISFALDGIANAAEALVGEAKGANGDKVHSEKMNQVVHVSLFWTLIFALVFCLFFAGAGEQLIALITSIPEVQLLASQYLPWMIALPIIACWCFLFDGIYVGLMQARVMRNSMLVATFIGFFPMWFVLQGLGNNGLWAAFSGFMLLRGLTLAWHFRYRLR